MKISGETGANIGFDTLKKIVNESRQLPDGGAELRGTLTKAEYDALGDLLLTLFLAKRAP
jgi:hypothetical protein